MTILTCDCGYEIYIMDETEATAWQCDRCGQWYDFFGVKVTPPSERKQEKNPNLVNWSAGEELEPKAMPHEESGAVCSQIAFVPLCGIA